jgi:hypothetical protein
MKKLILLILTTASLMANDIVMIKSMLNDYNTQLTSYTTQFNEYIAQFNSYNQELLTTSAGLTAISNIDFNPNHQGLSAGIGLATTKSTFGNGDAVAFGIQYGHNNVAINVKGTTNGNSYLLGSGIVISF